MLELVETYPLPFAISCIVGIGLSASVSLVIYQLSMGVKIQKLRDEWMLDHEGKLAQAANALHQKDLDLARREAELVSAGHEIADLKSRLDKLQEYKERYVQIQTRFEEQAAHLQAEKSLMDKTREHLFKEFELAANKLFESKQEKFTATSRQSMEAMLMPFREQLKAFNQRVEDVYHKENSQRNQLIGQIAELQKQTVKISSEANNLANALKGDNKTQGNWGEIVLERLLEQSGLQKGSEYETQRQYANEMGNRLRPDVIVHLPEGKDIVIDSKVSLVDYERYSQLNDVSGREDALKRHVDSIRSHIRGLSLKNYEQLEGVRTLDFVFIFVPVEAAYIAAMQAAPSLFKEGYDKNIVLVSPSSLMVALRTVETLWRYEKQNKNAEKIAESAGKLYDQFVMLINAMEEVGQYLGKTTKAYDTVFKRLNSGRGNLVKRVEDLRILGAKTSRQLPEKMKPEADDVNALDDKNSGDM